MIEKIISRYSCRKFLNEEVKEEDLTRILEAARWAPSGLNNQPWRFIIVKNNLDIKEKLAKLTSSEDVIRESNVNILVFLYLPDVYSRTKDILAIGACIENILLAAHSLGYGCCWLGEILNNSDKVLQLFNLDPKSYELMAVVSIGRPNEPMPIDRERISLQDLIIKKL